MKLCNLLFFGLIIILVSCEGFKVLTLHNFSTNSVSVTIKPGISTMKEYEVSNYPNNANTIADSVIIELPKDSSLVLTSIFTSFMGGAKLKEEDIQINYLRIKTPDTVIVAESKHEIIKLLNDDSFKYKKQLDKKRGVANSRNWGNIIIRK